MKLNIPDFEAVLFDLDGTMIDSMGMWSDIDVDYLARFGYEKPENLQRELEGLSFREAASYFQKRFKIPDSIDKICDDWLSMADYKYKYEVPLKPGVAEFLTYIKTLGIKTAIASSNHADLIEGCIRAHGLEGDIDKIITCDDVCANKPDPAVYITGAKMLNVPPEKCLVFEDIPLGIKAGKNAGMTVCAVHDSYSASVSKQKAELADAVIADYRELIP